MAGAYKENEGDSVSATPVLLAGAIASVINTEESLGTFAPHDFSARRSYPDWDDDFGDLRELAVDVVFVASDGSGMTAELDSANTLKTEPAIDIAIRKRFEAGDRDATTGRLKNASVDDMVELVEKIYELFSESRATPLALDEGITANWVDCVIRTHCDYGKLRQGYFLGVVRVRWNVSKDAN